MNRRSVLGGLATAAVGIAGCLGDGNEGDGPAGADAEAALELTGTSFRVDASGCDGGREDASVAVRDGTVVVDGRITGGEDTTTAALRGAVYDSDADVLRVSVGTVSDGDAEPCPTAVDYGAEIGFEGQRPGATAVYHDGVRVDAAGGSASVASFDVTGVEASPPRDEATVRRSGRGRIVVEGALAGPDGCTTAAVDGVAYDAGRDRLVVELVPLQETTPPCSDGTVEIGYRLEARVPVTTPTRVSVVHDGDPVAGATWRDGSGTANGSDGGG